MEVDCRAVKFWRVEEALVKRLVKVPRPEEVKLPPEPVVKKRLVEEAVVLKKLVVVALVPVALLKVKFWRVVEPEESKSPAWFTENLVVEATFKSSRRPEKPVIASTPITVPEVPPTTESLA